MIGGWSDPHLARLFGVPLFVLGVLFCLLSSEADTPKRLSSGESPGKPMAVVFSSSSLEVAFRF